MKKIGLIAEYNPFHNGHLYQINKIKEMYPDSLIILVLSSSFMQRGELSIINKWDKTLIALNNNIDLILELPFFYATQGADIFASGAIQILKELSVDILVFGSETNDIELLTKLAKIQINNKEFDILVKEYLDNSLNYPTALSKAIQTLTNNNINKPNDLLGISYIKEIIKQNTNIEPILIKRTNDYHGKIIESNIISASLIRSLIKDNKDISQYVPSITLNYINKINEDKLFELLKYQIIININNLSKFQSVDEGIENRIKKYIYISNSLEELINNIKSKRYTYNRIKRMLTHILVGFLKENNTNKEIEYIRILGFNKEGQLFLNKIKKNINVPLISIYKTNLYSKLDLEYKVTNIYSLITEDNTIIKKELQNKPIIL